MCLNFNITLTYVVQYILIINHFGDTIILKNLEAMKDFCRGGFIRVLILSIKEI